MGKSYRPFKSRKRLIMFALHSAINNERELIDCHRGENGMGKPEEDPSMEFTFKAIAAMERELKDLRASLPTN